MKWVMLARLAVMLLREMLSAAKSQPDCPGGVCEAAEERAESVQAELEQPDAAGIIDIIGCVDFGVLIGLGRRWFQLISDAMNCGEPVKSIGDFLECVDITQAIALVRETIEFIASTFECSPEVPSTPGPDAPTPQ